MTNRLQITVNDKASFSVSSTKRVYTDEGFLKVPGRVARVGVQDYLAGELGLTDRPAHQIVKVYRPAESVFDEASLSTYCGADVTIEHPSSMVDVSTYKDTSVGVVISNGTQDGDFVVADLVIKSQDAIDAIKSGKVQLSAGYTAIYDEAPKDSPYDFIQTDIKINHVALVDRARAGYEARLFDNKGVKPMAVKVTLDSGKTVEFDNENAATLVADSIERLTKAVKDAEKREEEQRAKAAAAEEKADIAEAKADKTEEELEKERAKTSKDSINSIITELMKVRSDAQRIAGDKFSCDSVAVIDNKRAAMVAINDSVDWPSKSDAYIEARFDTQLESMDAAAATNSHQRLAQDAATAVTKQTSDAAPVLSRSQQYTNKQLGVK